MNIQDRLIEIKTQLVDESLAKQLQRSMERNARMVIRLTKLGSHRGCPVDVQRVLQSILSDREPPWHQG